MANVTARLDVLGVPVTDLDQPRLSLRSLRGARGIKLGNSRRRMVAILGASELNARRGPSDAHPHPRGELNGQARPGFVQTGLIGVRGA